jgi:sec-independent protein translocase protein TatA
MGLDNPLHILVLLLVVLLVFGAKRLPEIGRALGDGIRGFKDSISPSTPAIGLQAATPTATHAATTQAPTPVATVIAVVHTDDAARPAA